MEKLMNFKEIQSRGYVIHVRSDSRIFKDDRYRPFLGSFSNYSWQYRLETFMHYENYRYLHTYSHEDETDKCFEIMYNTNYLLLERALDNVGAKLITITKSYMQTNVSGFRLRTAKMPYPLGILFDTMQHKMLYLVKNAHILK